MKDFIVKREPIFLFDGVIGLTEAQAARRRHAVTPCKRKGEYTIISQVCFKQGEIIGLPVPVAKTIRHLVEPFDRKTED